MRGRRRCRWDVMGTMEELRWAVKQREERMWARNIKHDVRSCKCRSCIVDALRRQV
jgi:hypothetical protein